MDLVVGVVDGDWALLAHQYAIAATAQGRLARLPQPHAMDAAGRV